MSKVISVVVVYNGMQRNWIEKCLNSLIYSAIPTTVVVIDNGSTDGSVEFVQKNYSQVQLVISSANLGFGKANNVGIKIALDENADYVFLLNQDAWIESNTIEKLVKAHKRESQFGIISPMHLNGTGHSFDGNFLNFLTRDKCNELLSAIFLQKTEQKIYPFKFINAAAWLISKKCVETVGGFSPSFFHYGEDRNYIQRAEYHNFKVGVVPSAIIYHDRETRGANTFFDSIILYERMTVLRIADPSADFSFFKEYIFLIKTVIKSLVTLRFAEIKQALFKLKILVKIDKKNVLSNRLLSQSKGHTFLQEI
jgi:GT2 family glycosyltransferase